MANRYWVGGTDTWDATAGSKWSTTSGGTGGSAVPTTSDTVFFDANSGAGTVTIGAGTATCSTLTMTGFTGTIAFGTNSITIAGSSATIYTGATTFSVTGTPVINCTYSGSTGTRSINPTIVTEANSISFNISAGGDTVAFGNQSGIKNLNFTGFTGTFNGGSNTRTIYGNLTLSTGLSLTTGTNTTTFGATSGTQTITSNAKTMDFPITFAGTATYQLVDALTSGATRTMTLTSGTLDLNNNTLTVGAFSSSNANTRSILFGTTGNITCSGTGTVWTTSTITGFSYTGTSTVNLTDSSSATRTILQGAGTAAQAINFYIKAGTGIVNLTTTSGVFQNIDCTGSTVSLGVASSIALYGNLILTNNTTANGTTLNILGTSGTQTITSNGFTIDNSININGVGGTVQLVDALTMGSTRTLTLTNGTFNSNAKNVTCGTFNANNTNTKTFTITNSTFTVLSGNSTTSGFFLNGVGTTYNVTGSNVVFTTSTAARYWGGSGSTFPAVTMSGTGQLIIGASGVSGTITTLSNTVQPCTISLNSNAGTLTVTNFNINGTAGNLVTLNCDVAGTARTISKSSGTVNAQYLSIKDSTATGGATWNASNSVAGPNNTGWNFLAATSRLRLISTGIMYAVTAELDEVSSPNISMSLSKFNSAGFDEVGNPGVAMRYGNGNIVQVSTEFDEVTTIS